MKKFYAILIALVLVLPMLSVATPVRASTGHPTLGQIYPFTMDDFISANYNVSLPAGALNVTLIDGSATTPQGWLAIVTAVNGTPLVNWQGAQFSLYMSQDGYAYTASADPSDILYAANLSVASLSQTLDVNTNVTVTSPALLNGNATFWLGTTATMLPYDGGVAFLTVIVGPIPFNITSNYQYIKLYDGQASAVSAQTVQVLPALSLTPTSGAAGTSVTLTGVALKPNELYNITYLGDTKAAAQVTTLSNGTFTFSWAIKDLGNDFYSLTNQVITINVIDNATGSIAGNVTFDEFSRVLYNIGTDFGTYGNNTFFDNNTVNVQSNYPFSGQYFLPNSNVTLNIDGNFLGTAPTNGTGFFNATFSIPTLTKGTHYVTVADSNYYYNFSINVLPTLIFSPKEGQINSTITVTTYGFDPGNLYLYWDTVCNSNTSEYNGYDYNWVLNTSIGSSGTINGTSTFQVPFTYGGDHTIYATTVYQNTTGPDTGFLTDITGTGTFEVLPTIFITPTADNNTGAPVQIHVIGLQSEYYVLVDIDNHYLATSSVSNDNEYYAEYQYTTECGELWCQFIDAGFYPGTHVVSIYYDENENNPLSPGYWGFPYYSNYTGDSEEAWSLPAVYGLFTVGIGNDLVIQAINNTMASQLAAQGAQITSIANDVVTVKTNTQTLLVDVAALNATITSINGNVATVQTTLGTIQGTLSSMQGTLGTVNTNVGQIQAKVTSGPVPIDTTPIWIAVILAAVAAIFSIVAVISIRSKIAA